MEEMKAEYIIWTRQHRTARPADWEVTLRTGSILVRNETNGHSLVEVKNLCVTSRNVI